MNEFVRFVSTEALECDVVVNIAGLCGERVNQVTEIWVVEYVFGDFGVVLGRKIARHRAYTTAVAGIFGSEAIA